MSNITNIPLDDIQSLLKYNNIIIPQNYIQNYLTAWDLILSGKLAVSPPSIADWIIAHNLSTKPFPTHNASDILLKSNHDHDLLNLSTTLTLHHIDKQRIIRILGFLGALNNDANIFDTLPQDVLIPILLNLTCKSLKMICGVSHKFQDFCLKHNIMHTRKYQGYPRSNGHCNVFYIPDPLFSIGYRILSDVNKFLLKALNTLYDRNIDLIRGDIVVFKDPNKPTKDIIQVYMFNGCKLEDLNYTYDIYEGNLPLDYRVIENGIPIKYFNTKGGLSNTIVWFNHIPMREQCLSNIEYRLLNEYGDYEDYGIITSFMYAGKGYQIIFEYTELKYEEYDHKNLKFYKEDSALEAINDLKKVLRSNKPIKFTNTSDSYDYIDNDHTLFTDINY